MKGDRERLEALEREAAQGGGAARLRRLKRLGRLPVRERLQTLLDAGSFREHGMLVQPAPGSSREAVARGDGMVTGLGTIDGRPVAVYGHDPTVLRGSLGAAGAHKLARLLHTAQEHAMPVVAIHDSDGVRVGEGPQALLGFGEVLGLTARLSGWVPQIGIVTGLCVGGAAYSSALQDIIIGHEEQGFLFVTGAKVTRTVTGEDNPIEEMGGVPMHAEKTGLVHLTDTSEVSCFELARRVLRYLPQCAEDHPPLGPQDDPPDRATPQIEDIVPTDAGRAYDMHVLLAQVLDQGSLLELQAAYGRALIVAFARLGGHAVGVVASQPSFAAGAIDVEASRKGGRFVRLCDAFNLPILTFADTPGFLPGRAQEQAGLLLHGAKLISAYSGCRVPLLSVVVRKSYGGANVLALPADVRLALPGARVQPLGVEAAVEVARHASFGAADEAELEAFEKSFRAAYDTLDAVVDSGFVDRVVRPAALRAELWAALHSTASGLIRRSQPPRHHCNIPL